MRKQIAADFTEALLLTGHRHLEAHYPGSRLRRVLLELDGDDTTKLLAPPLNDLDHLRLPPSFNRLDTFEACNAAGRAYAARYYPGRKATRIILRRRGAEDVPLLLPEEPLPPPAKPTSRKARPKRKARTRRAAPPPPPPNRRRSPRIATAVQTILKDLQRRQTGPQLLEELVRRGIEVSPRTLYHECSCLKKERILTNTRRTDARGRGYGLRRW